MDFWYQSHNRNLDCQQYSILNVTGTRYNNSNFSDDYNFYSFLPQDKMVETIFAKISYLFIACFWHRRAWWLLYSARFSKSTTQWIQRKNGIVFIVFTTLLFLTQMLNVQKLLSCSQKVPIMNSEFSPIQVGIWDLCNR